MSEQRKQTRIIHLAKDDYIKLINYGSITVDGKVIEYSDNDVHVTPSIIDESNIVFRNMTSEDGSFSTEYNEAGVEMNGFGTSTAYTSVGIFVDTASGGNKLLSFPSKSGTLATTDDCKKLYRHKIQVEDKNYKYVYFSFISSKETMYTLEELVAFAGSGKLGYCTGVYDGKIITINSVLDMNGTYYFSGYDSQTSKIISVDSSTFKDTVYDI